MNKPRVVIVDYGVGNLLSVQRAVEECGAQVITSSEPNIIAQADRVILPGVGAFANGMQALESLGLVKVIKAIAADGIPLLGICLGMQLLFDESEEYGLTKGLGIIPGRIVSIPSVTADEAPLKIPHIGWNTLLVNDNGYANEVVPRHLIPRDAVYFIHSFMAKPEDPKMKLADSVYGGHLITAMIGCGTVVGCQFHPEKSGRVGLEVLKGFIFKAKSSDKIKSLI